MFLAREARVVSNGGAYTGMGATALYLTGFFHSFPYKWGGYRYDGYRVYTNTLPSTSMRGFGAPQAMWCSEQQLEWIAADLGLDPIEMRRKNGHTAGYEVPGQAFIGSSGLDEALTITKNGSRRRKRTCPRTITLVTQRLVLCPAVSLTGLIHPTHSHPQSLPSMKTPRLSWP